ncbi:MAG: sodium:solute symporter family protein [Oligoflexia bacterium]|nr:sodium:solute symporter family protein [Oligoflexia bacterium]
MKVTMLDYSIICIYFLFVIGIGFLIKKRIKNSNEFFMSGRSIPLWITSLSFIAANLGAQEVIGMAASGAKYGIMTAHFYWLGAIPAMVFLGIFMMPFYYGSRARSVPEYLFLRFDEKTRALNALSFATMTIFSSGISLYALALLMQNLLGWSFETSIILSAGIVMAYTFLGGLTSAIYNEVLQFFLIVLGIFPVVLFGLISAGGWSEIVATLPQKMTHTWSYMGSATSNDMGVNMFAMIMGLGFVLSFGYWCTDFLVVQRAMVAKNMSAAQKTPMVAAFPKMLMPFVVILPGLVVMTLQAKMASTGFSLPLKVDGRPDFDMALPSLLFHFAPTGLLGLGLTALMASFMSGMAGNVTAFNSVWTYDIYQAYFNKNASDKHYLTVGKLTTIVGILLSIATAYMAKSFNNIMDFLQLVFGFVNAPLFATFLLGMSSKRITGHGAFWGLLSGTISAALTHGLTLAEGKGGWLLSVGSKPCYEFISGMGQAFTIAIVAWSVCFVVTIAISVFTKAKDEKSLMGLVYGITAKYKGTTDTNMDGINEDQWYFSPKFLGAVVLLATLLLNIIFY